MKDTNLQTNNPGPDGLRRALCGFGAMVATAATLGLTVLAPVAAAPGEPMMQALVNHKRLVLGPAEVAIVPSPVEVIAIRTPHTDPLTAPSGSAPRV